MSASCRVWLIVGLMLLCRSNNSCLSQSGQVCPPVKGRPSCVCKHTKGIIDLTQVGLQGSKAPRFTGLKDPNTPSMMYSYNPCYQFTKDTCSQAYACDIATADPTDSFSITNADSEVMYIDTDGTPYVFYTGPTDNVKVYLHCTDDQNLDAKSIGHGGTFTSTYKFNISSCQVCPGGCKKSSIVLGVAGLVVMIILVLAVLTYFVVGASVLKFKYERSGSDIIPHKNFWRETLLLIKDGCVFTFEPIRRLASSRKNGYVTVK